MYPYTAKRRDWVDFPRPEARDVPKDISKAKGNLEVGGDVQPDIYRLKAVYGHSLIIIHTKGCIRKYIPAGQVVLAVLKSVLPCYDEGMAHIHSLTK